MLWMDAWSLAYWNLWRSTFSIVFDESLMHFLALFFSVSQMVLSLTTLMHMKWPGNRKAKITMSAIQVLVHLKWRFILSLITWLLRTKMTTRIEMTSWNKIELSILSLGQSGNNYLTWLAMERRRMLQPMKSSLSPPTISKFDRPCCIGKKWLNI